MPADKCGLRDVQPCFEEAANGLVAQVVDRKSLTRSNRAERSMSGHAMDNSCLAVSQSRSTRLPR